MTVHDKEHEIVVSSSRFVCYFTTVILGGATKKDVSPRRKTATISRLTFDLMP